MKSTSTIINIIIADYINDVLMKKLLKNVNCITWEMWMLNRVPVEKQ